MTASPLQFSATQDIEAQSALLSGWNQSYAQLSGGAFRGSLAEARLPSLYMFREITSQTLFQAGEVGADVVAVGVPLRLSGAARFCGARADGRHLHLFSGGDGFEFHTPAGLDMAGLVLPRAAFGTQDLGSARLLDVSPEALRGLRRLILEAFEAVSAANAPAVAADLTEALRAAVSDEGEGDDLPKRRHRDLLAELRARVIAQEEMPRVDQLCADLAISRRSLQNLCQSALNMRPLAYIKALRLNLSRQHLYNGMSVTQAATEAGFWHFGRFAQDYAALFGELPSATLRRRLN